MKGCESINFLQNLTKVCTDKKYIIFETKGKTYLRKIVKLKTFLQNFILVTDIYAWLQSLLHFSKH